MLIYITGYVQFSIFSSGHHQVTLQTALGLQQLGHTVKIVNILDNNATSWEDFDTTKVNIQIIQKTNCSEKADILIDTIGCLLNSERQQLATSTVMFIREPPLLSEIEKCIYPANTLKRNYEGISEIWTYDLFTENDCIMLQILGNCPVRVLPLIWSPIIIEIYSKQNNIFPWFVSKSSPDVATFKQHLMIAEVNMTVRSNCTLPLTIWREFSIAYPDIINDVKISNGKHLEDRAFFKDNILAHTALSKGQSGSVILEGRSRSVDWTMNPKTIVLAHLRFAPFRWLYLDCAWMGIPLVHNCLLLKQMGEELAEFYYENNSISQGANALKKCCDFVETDYFNETRLLRTRHVLANGLSILRTGAKEKWIEALHNIKPAPIVESVNIPYGRTY